MGMYCNKFGMAAGCVRDENKAAKVFALIIPLVEMRFQESVIDFLNKKGTAIDTAIEQKQNLIEKLTEYKKSLIYECVTGKKEI